MANFGFTASASARVVAVLLFGAGTTAAVWTITTPRPVATLVHSASDNASQRSEDTVTVQLRLESTAEIREWSVTLDQQPVQPSATDAKSWQGELRLSAESEVLVDTPLADAGVTARALKVHISREGVEKERVLWSESDIVERFSRKDLIP